MNLKFGKIIEFFNFSNFTNKITKPNKCTINLVDCQNEERNMVYCTICDLLHVNCVRMEHCKSCNKCHARYKILCTFCQNCYDYRIDNDIIRHRKFCKYSN
jgi:hypothetical protein